MSEDYESVLLVKHEVFVYKIPPLASARGHKAADWKLDSPDFVGRLRLVSRGKNLDLKLEDKSSGDLFAKCPVDKYPGTSIEPVTDSSRYFVIRLQDDNGRTAFIGIGFADRGDSFDLNVALQDHFKYLEKSAKFSQEQAQGISNQPKLDLSFKEGQTITLNIGKREDGGRSSSSSGTSRPRSAGTGNVGGPVPLLPPPPGAGARLPPSTGYQSKGRASPSASVFQQAQSAVPAASSLNPFLSGGGVTNPNPVKPSNALLDFDSFASALPNPSQASANPFLDTTGSSAVPPPIHQQSSNTAAIGNLLDL